MRSQQFTVQSSGSSSSNWPKASSDAARAPALDASAHMAAEDWELDPSNEEFEILSELLSLERDGCKVAWPQGWDARLAASAIGGL